MRTRRLLSRLFSPKLTTSTLIPLDQIFTSKRHALRRGVWFRALNSAERGILDLTMRYVATIKSTTLAKVVTAIITKLQCAMECVVDRWVRTVGLPLARKISSVAVSWGNHLASRWADDHAFARFLAFNFAKT